MLFRSDELLSPESSGCRLSGTERNRRTLGQESSWKEDDDYTEEPQKLSKSQRSDSSVKDEETGRDCYEAGKECSSEASSGMLHSPCSLGSEFKLLQKQKLLRGRTAEVNSQSEEQLWAQVLFFAGHGPVFSWSLPEGIQKTLVKLRLMQTETGRAPGSQVEAQRIDLDITKVLYILTLSATFP